MPRPGHRTASRRLAAAAAAGATLLLAAGCAPPAPEAPPAPPNLLLISIDTLRADHLGCYGYRRDTSPRLDALAAESVRFTAAYAPAPWTLPSHASILTGMHPYELGFDNQWRTLPEETPVIAEPLARVGYRTAAFVDSQKNGFVGAGRGFGRGFDLYQHAPHRQGGSRFDMAATADAAIAWLDRQDRERPFFLFLHTKSVHAVPDGEACLDPRCFPYDKPEPYRFRYLSSAEASAEWTSPEDGSGQAYLWSQNAKILRGELDPAAYPGERIEVLKALYDAGIYYVDEHLGRLFDHLRQRGLDASTAIVLTSDHGEAFLDHSLFMHQEVYDSLLRVPLIVRLPATIGADGGRVVERQVTLADIAPTLLRLAGARIPEALTGRPLPLTAAAAETPAEARDLFAYYLFPGKFTYQAFALRRGDLKLVVHNIDAPDRFRYEVYDTRLDPRELHPLAATERQGELRQALGRYLRQEPRAQGRELRSPASSGPTHDILRSLGYIE
jgi:arylsulfatase A-like enzyme